MARGNASGGPDRGGGGIPAARPAVARVAAAVAALGACGGLAVYPAVTADRFGQLVAVPGVAAAVVLAAALAWAWPAGIAWTLGLLGGAYAASLAVGPEADTVDAVAPLYAGGLLLLAELAYWSLELRGAQREETAVLVRRLVALLALAALSVAVGGFVVLVTAAPLGGGLAWDAVGIAAVAATLAIVARLARRGAAAKR